MQEAVGSYSPWRLKKQLQNTPTHSNQQLVTPLEHFWTKFFCDCKKFDTNFFLLHYYTVLARSKLNNIWRFMYTSNNIHRNLPASDALQSVEYSIQAKMLNAALQNTLCYPCNTPEHRRNTFLGLYLAQRYAIWQGLEHCLVSLGACIHAAFMINSHSVLPQLNCLQLVTHFTHFTHFTGFQPQSGYWLGWILNASKFLPVKTSPIQHSISQLVSSS